MSKLKKAVERLNRRITRSNKAFEKLTATEKRVAIARDVLAQLKAGRIKATNGQWIGKAFRLGQTTGGVKVTNDTQVNALLKTVKTCDACALGAMFMCAVDRANALKVSELDPDHDEGVVAPGNDAPDYLKRFFSENQVELIESAFERNDGAFSTDTVGFAPDAHDPTDRMRLIMENIIVNGGRFNPSKQPRLAFVTVGFDA